MSFRVILPLILIFLVDFSYCQEPPNTRKEVLNVYAIPHSHCDLGWLQTIGTYFYGNGKFLDGDAGGVQFIIGEVLGAVSADPTKKFVWAEIGYFYLWWRDKSDEVKDHIRKLVKEGRFEFVNGGWSMHDEATSYYEDMIDNMALGHDFLRREFDVVPTVGWQIDTFGHSNTNAAFFSQMGFDAFWVARIDYQDKDIRSREKRLQTIWRPKTSQGKENEIFFGIFYGHYEVPGNFCFDLQCLMKYPPVIDDPAVPGYNVNYRSDEFSSILNNQGTSSPTNDLLIPLGRDFGYTAAQVNFQSFDRLFNYINKHPEHYNLNITYATPTTYLNELYKKRIILKENTEDFFPYSDSPGAYWTGYFTSRPALKGNIRSSAKVFQNAKRLLSYTIWRGESSLIQNFQEEAFKALNAMGMKLAELQHHDAITGTSKQRAVNDYVIGLNEVHNAVEEKLIRKIFSAKFEKLTSRRTEFTTCKLNETFTGCDIMNQLENEVAVVVGVFNPVSDRNSIVEIKAPHSRIQAYSMEGKTIPTDIICNPIQFVDVECRLFFKDAFRGYGLQYYILISGSVSNRVKQQTQLVKNITTSIISFNFSNNQTLQIDSNLKTLTLKTNSYETKFTLDYKYYRSQCSFDKMMKISGAYLFVNGFNRSFIYDEPANVTILQGKIVTHLIFQYIEEKLTAKIRLVNDDITALEIESFLKPIDVGNTLGKEVLLVVKSDRIKNNKTFYTDSNGMELQKRILNYRPTWKLQKLDEFGGNYYPITSTIMIEDVETQERMALITDRAHGGASLNESEIEIMLHRTLLCDDHRGLEDPLKDETPQNYKTSLVFSNSKWSKGVHRKLQFTNDQPNLLLLSKIPFSSGQNISLESLKERMESHSELLNLPSEVKLLVNPYNLTSFIVRFHNMNEDKEAKLSSGFLSHSTELGFYELTEMGLSANQRKEDILNRKLDWSTYKGPVGTTNLNRDYETEGTILLRPLEIRTFLLQFRKGYEEDYDDIDFLDDDNYDEFYDPKSRKSSQTIFSNIL